MTIRGLNHNAYRCKDSEEPRRFYENFLGLPLAEAFERYEREVSKKKRGFHAESLRFGAWLREFPALCGKVIHAITPADIGMWRAARAKLVRASSAGREAAHMRDGG